MNKIFIGIVPMATVLAMMMAGCSHQASDTNSLAQQKANVMGSPAPAAVQAQIAAQLSQQQAAIKQHMQGGATSSP